ncbi:endonuclease [Listeria monocytogenes]|uniref:endonuclease n=1 Tax=Listeria innocua TaxID=1642 RepID=UPI0016287E11|nr:endonuclease [Listeria innocua]EHK4067794.1 endonuclease [Listeria monocytogenes]MBC2238806.1 endonuclease [Listeria innocua]HBC0574103.1 endonuclease [Listeria monocytogenes]
MDFDNYKNSLNIIIERLETIKRTIKTEEATKITLVLPFFQALNYDIFNPQEFVPDYTADSDIIIGETVDYAIMKDGNPTILINVKPIDKSLQKHDSQLFSSFGTSNTKIGILTNGDEYLFFTDLDEPNKMDSAPFLSFCLSTIEEKQISELSKFHKDNFNMNSILKATLDLKHMERIRYFLHSEFNSPSKESISFILNSFYTGRKKHSVIKRFSPMIKQSMHQFITDEVNNKLNTALNSSILQNKVTDVTKKDSKLSNDDVVVIKEKIAACTITKLILKDSIDLNRLSYKDNKSHFSVQIDTNNRKWLFRLYTNNTRSYIVFNDRNKTELDIIDAIDIYNYKEKMLEVVNQLLHIV